MQIFSNRTRKLVKTISRFTELAHSGEIRIDGKLVLAGDDSGAIQVFDLNSRAILRTWKEHKQPVWKARFSPDVLTSIMSVSDDKTVKLWDLPTAEAVTTFVGHTDYVRTGTYLSGSTGGQLIVSGSYDGSVKLWDARAAGRSVMTFKHAAPVEDVLPMANGTTILASADNQVSVLNLVASKVEKVLHVHQKTVTSLALASKGTRVISGGLDGHVKVFETTGWNVVADSKYSSPILSLGVITTGEEHDDFHLVVGMQSGLLSIKSRITGAQKKKEAQREKEMKALLDGNLEQYDKEKSRRRKRGRERIPGKPANYAGEPADIVVEGEKRRKKLPPWQRALHQGEYAKAMDWVLDHKLNTSMMVQLSCFTALRHQHAFRAALKDRDDVSLQPIIRWVSRQITDPRFVVIAYELALDILDLYSNKLGESKAFDSRMIQLITIVRQEVEYVQQACQTQGMLDMILPASA